MYINLVLVLLGLVSPVQVASVSWACIATLLSSLRGQGAGGGYCVSFYE